MMNRTDNAVEALATLVLDTEAQKKNPALYEQDLVIAARSLMVEVESEKAREAKRAKLMAEIAALEKKRTKNIIDEGIRIGQVDAAVYDNAAKDFEAAVSDIEMKRERRKRLMVKAAEAIGAGTAIYATGGTAAAFLPVLRGLLTDTVAELSSDQQPAVKRSARRRRTVE